ncbi:hypothetical protein Tco_0450788 [Tanacetum coccineum]
MDLMKQVCKPYLGKFVIVIHVYVWTTQRRRRNMEVHLKLVVDSLRKDKLMQSFSNVWRLWFISRSEMDEAHASRRKSLEFEVGDRVLLMGVALEVVMLFGKNDKLGPSLHVPLNEIKVDKTLRFIEEPVEILDREIKSLKRSKISLVKFVGDSKRGPESTWSAKII